MVKHLLLCASICHRLVLFFFEVEKVWVGHCEHVSHAGRPDIWFLTFIQSSIWLLEVMLRLKCVWAEACRGCLWMEGSDGIMDGWCSWSWRVKTLGEWMHRQSWKTQAGWDYQKPDCVMEEKRKPLSSTFLTAGHMVPCVCLLVCQWRMMGKHLHPSFNPLISCCICHVYRTSHVYRAN